MKAAPQVLGIHHFTIRCTPAQLEGLKAFYSDVLGMQPGPRPAFGFPGHWMYVGEQAVVHLAAILREDHPAEVASSGFDHVSLHTRGLEATRQRLKSLGVAFDDVPVPGWPLQQIFLRDPVGSKIELTFEVPE
ncbi:VOC family protein [Ramlibacter albus]|uniref:VOC family protein n=1 Tax=Ramlibacter albus TaxID=2079448 RepID=A0A923MEV2_9BURK|nr:VOC family protein [Ramlibacter albus]MBC5768223.1 VOC family protein [Ramlibacter albus]